MSKSDSEAVTVVSRRVKGREAAYEAWLDQLHRGRSSVDARLRRCEGAEAA
ncbi:MAG: hypothetical protein R3F14_44130 [Polyangiaceae bacterium]